MGRRPQPFSTIAWKSISSSRQGLAMDLEGVVAAPPKSHPVVRSNVKTTATIANQF
jgi:hypothetical protein